MTRFVVFAGIAQTYAITSPMNGMLAWPTGRPEPPLMFAKTCTCCVSSCSGPWDRLLAGRGLAERSARALRAEATEARRSRLAAAPLAQESSRRKPTLRPTW